MRFTTILIVGLASVATSFARPNAESSQANCGYPNGNCYQNDCHGELSIDRITCFSGPYRDCPCGYNCGSNVGKCNENGCEGHEGRCTRNYLGCSCV
ncbi:hypothetical protein TEQG_00968 [Trichophyton equinum CBS 127.97]|uniref:Uncharacterized protein n=1 Tax=Trichophyton equinum (strain ATCC MYA-4606 / CBS 127.97) TaxID=559882 RepID=F2PJ60_TRIEC|nr:hypothetical protein TEQG_00968 [Trichophyton equinum CBS 127.97]